MNVANTYVPRIGPWAALAACIGTDPALWFSGSYREARQICAGCPVRRECLRWAIETRTDHGLFGGLNPKERRAHRAQAGQAQLTAQESEEVRYPGVPPAPLIAPLTADTAPATCTPRRSGSSSWTSQYRLWPQDSPVGRQGEVAGSADAPVCAGEAPGPATQPLGAPTA